MPDYGLIGGAVGVGYDILTNRRNYKRSLEQRDYDKQWQIDQMNIQRQWALEDWTRQNEYDSAKQQKQRLKDAGLNTNLLYGGHVSSASNDIRPSTSVGGNRQPYLSDTSVGSRAATQMSSLAINQEQIQNMKAQQDLLFAQTNQSKAGTIKTLADTKMTETQRSQLEASFAEVLRGIQLTNTKTETEVGKNVVETERIKVLTEIEQNRDNREKIANSANVALTMQKIITEQLAQKKAEWEIEQQPTKKAMLETELRQLQSLERIAFDDMQMKIVEQKIFTNYGITKSDPYYLRVLIKEMSKQ